MSRQHIIHNCETGEIEYVPFSAEEEAERDKLIEDAQLMWEQKKQEHVDAYNSQQAELQKLSSLGIDPIALGIHIIPNPEE